MELALTVTTLVRVEAPIQVRTRRVLGEEAHPGQTLSRELSLTND